MKKIIYALVVVCTLSVWTSCKKNPKNETGQPEPPDNSGPVTTKIVKVSFPDGMSVNLSEYTLSSLSVDTKLDASGNVNAAYNAGLPNIAWLFDKDNNLVLAGFMTDSTAAINAASTAKVMLYYGFAMPYKPVEVTDRFIKEVQTVKGVDDFVGEFANLLKNDRLVLKNGGYTTALKNAIRTITKEETVDLRTSSASDIQVEDTEIKSGLQVAEDGLSKLSITNTYRRRAHAFFYKMKFKDLNGTEKGVISEINATTPADRNEGIDPVGAVNSVTGVLGAWLEDKAMDFAAVKAGPFDIPLTDFESEATYKVRIVGPGQQVAANQLSNAESTKLLRLQIETLAIDFLLPVLASQIAGKMSAKGKPDASAAEKEKLQKLVEGFSKLVEELIKSTPGAYDEMKKGKYDVAVTKILEGLYSGTTAAGKEAFAKILTTVGEIAIQQKYYVKPSYDYLKDVDRKLKILDYIDKTLTVGDYVRILYDLNSSRTFEEWTVKARSSKVSLDPAKSAPVAFTQIKLSATIKNLVLVTGTHPYYEWKTSGKYGKLTDTKGHKNQTEFESADKDVFYYSNASAADLKDENNFEYVYVTAFYDGKKIGTDTAVINVKKESYKIYPDGIIVSGQESKPNSAKLYLETIKGTNDINSSTNFDYKMVWSTPGQYGKLAGANSSNGKSVTTYNDNSITYRCFDKDTKEATEPVSVNIYIKNKAQSESDYVLFETTKANVKIDNDEKKKIFYLPLKLLHGDDKKPYGNSGGFSYRCRKSWTVSFPEDKDAKSYTVTAVGGNRTFSGGSYSWKAGDPNPSPPWDFVAPGYSGGMYTIDFWTGTWSVGGSPGHIGEIPPVREKAQIIIYLK